jgi:hypothetical protein
MAQQDASTTLISLHFHYGKDNFGQHSKNVKISIFLYIFLNCISQEAVAYNHACAQ